MHLTSLRPILGDVATLVLFIVGARWWALRQLRHYGLQCRACAERIWNADVRATRGKQHAPIIYHERCWQELPLQVRQGLQSIQGRVRQGVWYKRERN